MLLEGFVSRVLGKLSSGSNTARLTPVGSIAAAMFEGSGDEASRAGIRYFIQSSAVTGIAPVQALPTTAAQWLIYNPAGNDTVWIDFLGMWLVSGTAGAGGSVLFGMCGAAHLPTTRPSSSASGITLANANPRSSRINGSGLIVASGQTLATSPGWAPIALMNPTGTVLGQTALSEPVTQQPGRIALGPDSGVALAVISPTGTTPLFAPFGAYREYDSDME